LFWSFCPHWSCSLLLKWLFKHRRFLFIAIMRSLKLLLIFKIVRSVNWSWRDIHRRSLRDIGLWLV